MKKINPFGCNFYLDNLDCPDRDVLIEKISDQYYNNPNSKPASWPENVHTSIHTNNHEIFGQAGNSSNLLVLLNEKVKELVKLENLENIGEFFISEMWYNAYRNGQHQYKHVHSNNYTNFFSGVYYFVFNEEHSSTRFYNPGFKIDFEKVLDHKMFTFLPKIKENDIIIFPSHVVHDVIAQYSHKLRITISFNVTCKFNEDVAQFNYF